MLDRHKPRTWPPLHQECRPRGQAGPPYHGVDTGHDGGCNASPPAPAQHAVCFERRPPRALNVPGCTLPAWLRKDVQASRRGGEKESQTEPRFLEGRCQGGKRVACVGKEPTKPGWLNPV